MLESERPEKSVGEMVSNYLCKQGRRMEKLAPLAAKGDEEGIHDLRVAIRRSRSLIQLFRREMKKTGARKLSKKLGRIAQQLGAVRDCDILLKTLAPLSDKEEGAEILAIRAEMVKRRTKALRETADDLADPSIHDTLSAIKTVASEFEIKNSLAVRELVPQLLNEQLSKLNSFQAGIGEAGEKQVHRLRIEAKRLRYSLEFLSIIRPKQSSLLIKPLVRFQDTVGSMRDMALASDILEGLPVSRALQQKAEKLREEAMQISKSSLGDQFHNDFETLLSSL